MTVVLAPATAATLARASLFDAVDAAPDEAVIAGHTYRRLTAAAPERPEAVALKRAVESGTLRVVPVDDAERFETLRCNPRLADADAATLALATLVSGVVATDGAYLGRLAGAEGIPVVTAPSFLLGAVSGGTPAPRALDAYDDLTDAGWHARGECYAAFIRALDARS